MKHTKVILFIVTALGLVLIAGIARRWTETRFSARAESSADAGAPRRVISMAPAITEVLFALGCGDRVVGVSDYCAYPPEAARKRRVGGYFNPDYETIAALEADLIILYPEQESQKTRVERLGPRTLVVNQETLAGLLESIARIGAAVGKTAEAAELRASLTARLDRVADITRNAPRPTVLITAGREAGAGDISGVFIAGKNNFYTSLLEFAGGKNAYPGTLPLPQVSKENIIDMAPDVIVEMLGDLAPQGVSHADIIADWQALCRVPAVADGRVYLFTDAFDVVPGPRIINTLEKLAARLHPDLFPSQE
ncbi:MAG: ABC transporter substrate-binding protein [Lentisphaeria bacterium]|nr:ABC transporter substrate-binding protein [Lentisphaeria bacterium]